MGTSVCEECKQNPWKYKCPGCSIRSCGLTCVKAHKNRTGCTGKRKLTDFVPLSKFDDNVLLSDYNMLEETKRVAESAKRRRNQLTAHPYFHIFYHLRLLQRAATSRRTRLLFLQGGMLMREKNKSAYNKWRRRISWTVEWRFHSTDVVLIDHGVGEDTNLCSVMENHLKPGPWIHKLKPFCDVDLNSLKLFIRQYPKGAKGPFKELDIKAPLRKQLANVAILEYPVIHVYLPSHSYDFEVIRDSKHVTTTPSPSDSAYDGQAIPNGVPSRVEEIEEEDDGDMNSSEPKVLDFIKHMNSNPRQRISEESKVEGDVVTNNSQTQVDPMKQEDAGNMELEFEQGLIDTYSDLFADMDPSDYFNFECEFAKGFDSDDNCDLGDLANGLNNDGLEEGEIVE